MDFFRSLPLFIMLASTMAQYEGHGLVGHRLEGHGLQGHGLQGHGLQGHGLQGHGLEGHGLEGHGLEGHGLEAYGLEGYEGYQHRPLIHHPIQEHNSEEYELDYHAHPKYSFDYSVKDPHTGDEKEHWETRDGDKVKGSYTLMETDGTKRIVEYEADDKNGFNAVVHRIGRPKAEHEEYKVAKPVYEPQYQEEYQQYDGGFVPITNFEHRH